jgi:NAD(P)-dependent dehydrogenase (short-subunit alcohol dehydrogenase family)
VQRLVVCSEAIAEVGETIPVRPGGEIWVADDGTGLSQALAWRLGEQGYEARLVAWDGIDKGVEIPERFDGLILVAPTDPGDGDALVGRAFRWLRAAGPGLRRAGSESGAVALTVSRLDGAFGARGLDGGSDPACGGLAGLIKTAGHEWPEVRCKAIDLEPAQGAQGEAVAAVLAELFRAGPAEVGLSADGRSTPVLKLEATGPPGAAGPIGRDDLVVITGGARGVTAEVAVALAKAFGPALVLLGRSPAPSPEPDWLAPLQGEAEIKRALATRANGRATPQLIGEQFRDLVANREILRNLARIESAGATTVYRQVDVRDPAAVAAAVAEARDRSGPVRGLVHGAGVLADRRIEDQTDDQFAEVYSTKVAGLRALLGAVGPGEPRLLVLFSSSTARFGRAGQVAYAAANEALNKLARLEAERRPDCRVVSVNWGPWDGGMVTPTLRPLFASEGIGLIPLQDGARFLVDEIRSASADRPVEVVVLGAGSVNPAAAAAPAPAPPPVNATTRASGLTTVFERALDPDAMPVLRSHVIDGRAVLPLALTLEWLAQGAIQRNPGLTFLGVDGLRLLKGAVVHDDQHETVAVLVGKAAKEDGGLFRVPVELRGLFADGRAVTHARGEVVLGDRPEPAGRRTIETAGLPAYGRSVKAVYHDVLFHGPDLHGLERVEACTPELASALSSTAPAPSAWLDRPLRQAWLTDPLVIDSAFQLLVLWSAEHAGTPALPTAVGRYRQFCRSFPGPRVQVTARVRRPGPLRAVAEIEFLDAAGAVLARIEGYECVGNPSLVQAFRRNRLPKVARTPG